MFQTRLRQLASPTFFKRHEASHMEWFPKIPGTPCEIIHWLRRCIFPLIHITIHFRYLVIRDFEHVAIPSAPQLNGYPLDIVMFYWCF